MNSSAINVLTNDPVLAQARPSCSGSCQHAAFLGPPAGGLAVATLLPTLNLGNLL